MREEGRLRSFGGFDPGSGLTLAACLSHASRAGRGKPLFSGGRRSNTPLTCPGEGDNLPKGGLIPRTLLWGHPWRRKGPRGSALGGGGGPSGSWWGKGPPSLRRVAGVRARPARGALRHGPHSYGRQQSGILGNGRKPDPATPRGGRSPSGCKLLLVGTNADGTHRKSPG